MPGKIRLASKQENDLYNMILHPLHDRVLKLVQSDKFYLTGGTCLSRYYYQHRYSDDLDLFYDGNKYDLTAFEAESRQFINRLASAYKLEISNDTEYFKQIFVIHDELNLKVDMVFEPVTMIDGPVKHEYIYIDTKTNMVANKLSAIYHRKTLKDYIDLYYLLGEFNIEEVIKWVNRKNVALNYEETILALVDGTMQGDVILIKPVDVKEFENFVKTLIDQLIKYAGKI